MADANFTTAEIQSEVIDYYSFSAELIDEIIGIDGTLFAIRAIIEQLNDDPRTNDSTLCGVKSSALITLNHARKNLSLIYSKIDDNSFAYVVKTETERAAA